MVKAEGKLIMGGVIVAGLALWWITRKGNASATGQAIGGAAFDLVSGVVGGAVSAASDAVGNTVQSAGTLIGIPKTNMTECQRAIAEGRTWDASFACPAADFLRYITGGKP